MRIAGIEVGRVGLGAMLLSTGERPPRPTALRALHDALDAGARHLDTADAYGRNRAETGHNERLVAEALRRRPDCRAILVATKGGHVRDDAGRWLVNGRPEHLRAACDASLRALGTECIDLYYMHRPDPQVPYAESIGALSSLRAAGKIATIGISNVDIELAETAIGITEIAAVQNELSPLRADALPLVRWCEHRGIPFLAWAPLGGSGQAGDLARRLPAFAEVAREEEASTAQIVGAWLMAKSPVLMPIPGFRRAATAIDSLGAAAITLSAEQRQALDASVAAPT